MESEDLQTTDEATNTGEVELTSILEGGHEALPLVDDVGVDPVAFDAALAEAGLTVDEQDRVVPAPPKLESREDLRLTGSPEELGVSAGEKEGLAADGPESKAADFEAAASLAEPPFMAEIDPPASRASTALSEPVSVVSTQPLVSGVREHISIEQQMERHLGVGGAAEIDQAGRIRVKTGGANTRFGHGRSIVEALYDLNHPGQLPTAADNVAT